MAYRAKQGDNKCTRGNLYVSWRQITEPNMLWFSQKTAEFHNLWFLACEGQTVQVRWTNKSSSGAIKSSYIDMNQSIIESLENALSYADLTVAMVLLVQKI
jgi:hypothetical protein